jgi:hypothetical protein
MHAAIWRFSGDPDRLLAGYDAMLAELPLESMRLHMCLRAPDGMVVIDTCPDRETFLAFAGSDEFRSALRRHGLPDPGTPEDLPVHMAVVDGRSAAQAAR